ncbi:hypothetical protein [Mesorhizobium sp. WSM2239]|uniref:Uncharacterized protein n=2 Tax=unclassified Mesorhizobium TaxID=325217 RepID=A0AAU8D5D0_9HYPH
MSKELIARLEAIKTFFVGDYGYNQAATIDEAIAALSTARNDALEEAASDGEQGK